jgi:competence protein ComEC
MILSLCINFILLTYLNNQLFPAVLLLIGTLILLKEDRVLLCLLIALMALSLYFNQSMESGEIAAVGSLSSNGENIIFREKGTLVKYRLEGFENNFLEGQIYKIEGYKSRIEDKGWKSARAKGIADQISVERYELIDRSPSLRFRLMRLVTERIDHRFREGGSIILAMIFGDRASMSKTISGAFKRFGLSHLLVVSGFHIGIITRSIERMFKRIRLPYIVRKALIWQILLILVYLSGCGVSVMRAVGQSGIKDFSSWVERKYDSLSALAALSLLFLVINPYLVFSFSYRLSFLSAFFIGWRKDWPVILAVYLGIFPIILTFSSDFNLLTLPVNFLMIGCVGTLLPLAMILLALPFEIPVICPLIGMLFEGIGEILVRISEIEWLNVRLTMPDQIHLTLYYGMIFLLIVLSENGWFVEKKPILQKITAMTALALLLVFNLTYRRFFEESILFIDVGSGDSTLINHLGSHLLIDAGSYNQSDRWLRRLSIRELEGVFISHEHFDHYGGLVYMNDILIHHLFMNEISVLNDWELLYNHIESLYSGTTYKFGEVELRTLWPEASFNSSDPNDLSQVIQFKNNDLSILFTGDMTRIVEEQLTLNQVDVLKVAHHGADTSSSNRSLMQLSPSLAIISVGENDRYGHPDELVVERLEEVSQKLLITKDCGSILLKYENDRIRYKFLKE